ncbi:hypothetical protein A2446_05420 [Candidatus Roizmanbacteria bacterium RIFOXYC2_FULL_38_9]|uniref:DUF4012 domain-containing protein n=1 Tax=Candidatus Roizmanbacteria bacterium RIFOXYD1_FULL_38_12 TaxID=1802093 RepID=A0A1F7KZW1_9BACT|nr:MAG: hypothetical protein A3K47_00890 [Candidatus Roizmanbacteria bacterium RIFOXYA2_FULL_38_14]OGK63343.1 MAG: hypothetical protein A3K27_00890 [Candidatus Roizmanbacteria bacterium RIFOXYA1_FULL_37_12]OGK65189.1 MAG: hypothetical protein A3K38_00890 [Candidatus Roizmanbacteria bacterium RIFOXYB1_FULL_40_23]OGK69594.1 MAG: hypothetical protein A3K21_00895 [Candidatus Roizmanbacteria bacterium RIFOXYC1_FULL_38_14]OGK72745.1 MAG: hypothetical protein A2446_05420 [Candidatus Roizmanbacteria ba
MIHKSSPISSRQKILIVSEGNNALVSLLKTYFKKFDNDVYISPKIPKSIAMFDYCFFINERTFIQKTKRFGDWKNIIFIVANRKKADEIMRNMQQKKLERIKIIVCPYSQIYDPHHVEDIVWFSISKSKETFLSINIIPSKPKALPLSPTTKMRSPAYYRFYLFIEKLISKKNITLIAVALVFVYHSAFIPPLLYGGYFVYQAMHKIQSNDYRGAANLIKQSESPILISKKMYAFARPTFLLFSIAQTPDDLFAVHEKILSIVHTAKNLEEDYHETFILFLNKNKSDAQKKQLTYLLESSRDSLSILESNLVFLNQKIPSQISIFKKYKEKLTTTSGMIAKLKKIAFYLPSLMAQKGEKKYLLLFANNMELRPGGGFIGSYGILTLKDLTFEGIEVYDVYDADGQLTAHIKPPDAIRDYLAQPHWFLRDSAFSPDFYENYFQAKFFLDKEKQLTDFSGGILITTTAIKNMLAAFGDLYLPDFNEKINSGNFYLKTQLYAEKDFFPGSTQKKSFLSALTRQLLVNLETVSESELMSQIFKSAEEKQLAFYIEEEELQKMIDSFYWSGRIIEPHCPPNIDNCYTDFQFPYDANLGVNKANFFVNRITEVKINIDSDGIINSKLHIKFKNESLQDIFPGGAYRNYFQILIPRDSVVTRIAIGEEPLSSYDQEIGQFKKVGFFFEIPIQSAREIVIEYHSLKGFKKGKSIYQLLFQKQIGSINNDMSLEITLPPNMFLANQNFSALVKNNRILYNTELSADKIFFVELLKE